MVPKIIIFVVFYVFLSLQLCPSIAQTNWIRVGYYRYSSEYGFPISKINSAFFTHIVCAYTVVNSTSYQLSLSPPDEESLSTFAKTMKKNNPSVAILLCVGGSGVSYSTFSSMVSNSSYRKSFINSSIKVARLYGLQGIDFYWNYPETNSDGFNMGILLQEWRAAIDSEARNSNNSQLILTAQVKYSPSVSSISYPTEKMQQHLDWVHVVAEGYTTPLMTDLTSAHATLYDPSTFVNTDYGIREWIDRGLSANKLVLNLPFYGYSWKLENPVNNGVGAPATGPAISTDGFLTYKQIKYYIKQYAPDVRVRYNSTYVVNYWTEGTTWIGFDDVEAITAKVSYAKEKKLLGYFVWEVSFDDNWVLSRTAAGVAINDSSVHEDNKNGQNNNSSVHEDDKNGQNNKRPLLLVLFPTTAAVVLLLGIFVIFYRWRRDLKLKGMVGFTKESEDKANKEASAFNGNVPNLIEYTLGDIEAATNGFSIENKLGQGGYGPVYKGILSDGQVIAVKKLSKTSMQGFEEFKNEVMLTAKLQHINLVRVLCFYIDKEEKILIYEYMQNKSLDSYLFDPIRRFVLDWKKRMHIIEGVTQAFLYLQEYSRFIVIHRDLKASNVLLDGDMKPKISDFGMARIFSKDDLEANTSRIVGTIGYVPPEYARKGIYSTKSDIYSFGVLLLQIISGKRISLLYGPNQCLSLLDYAYELWNDGKGMEFMDESLDDTYSSCKLLRCLQIALLCVQENPIDRPSMLEVFTMLKNVNTNMMIPKKPAFSKQNEQNKHTRKLEGYSGSTSSINDVTISDFVAR